MSEAFHAEVFAAEPQVIDPVEIAFDENGRAYVAEMLDYPDDPPPGKPPRSRIRLLVDTNGDGKADKSVIFADQLLQVSGLLPWNGGIIATSAPDILFLKDTDGDGKADVRQVLYTGFPKVNPEARITNPRLGMDNWIYCANNGSDARIGSTAHPERAPVLVRGTDFRFHPIRGVAEPASGPTQYGMSFDDWGNRFLTQNTVHIRHAVIPMQYLLRSPFLDAGPVSWYINQDEKPVARMFPLTGPQQWRVERSRLRQQRYDENKLDRIEQVAGYFTAATGGTVYTGDAFPPEYRGSIFIGDVSGNLVHRETLTPDGVTFASRRAKPGVEFLASTDPWFRPCNFANAPDGNLYFADIYREFIETPESIPEEIKKDMDFYSGDTMGRIYRIAPDQPRRKRGLQANLGKAPVADLVANLENENGWHRATAQRLIVERQDRSAVPYLRDLAARSKSPLARVHALWTLEGLGELKPEEVVNALKDPQAGVREQALRLAEPFLDRSPAVNDAVLTVARDPEVRVQYQLAFTLGQTKDPRALPAMAALAAARASDRWFRVAILSSVGDSAGQLLAMVAPKGVDAELIGGLAALIGSKRSESEIGRALTVLAKLSDPEPGLRGLARGLQLVNARALRIPAAEMPLQKFLNSGSEKVQEAAWAVARHLELRQLIDKAIQDTRNASLPLPRRVSAVHALGGGNFASAGPVLRSVLSAMPPAPMQVAAVDSLAEFGDPSVPGTLLEFWKSYSPDARVRVVAALIDRKERVPALLQAIEQGQVEPGAIDVAARARLMELSDSALSARAHKLFQSAGGDRMQVFQAYKDVLNLRGDPARGKTVFDTNCARCHMPRIQGGRVGPDLSGVNNKTKEELLLSILNPSYAVEPRFTNYLVTTKDGRLHDGVIVNETPAVLTLRGGTGETDDLILRSEIVEVRASQISLMPEEMEKSMSRQEVADVIAYLRAGL